MNKLSRQAASLLRQSLYLMLLAITTAATADDAALYGPEAPPGSAFIRIFNATPTTIGDASVAGKPFRKLAQYEASDFQFVANGSYVLKIGEATEQVPMRAGKYYTATVDSHGIKVHELTPPENRLKALVMVFNLTERPGIALKTQDGEQIELAELQRSIETPERLLLTEEIKETVIDAMNKLPDDLRAAITLREVDGMSYEEIATAMDCPIGTVRSRIFHHPAGHRGFLYHCGELENIHIRHTALCMARIKIAAKQIILLFSGPRGDAPALQRGVALQDPLLRLARLKLGDIDPRRKAGRARGAGRAIQNILRPPEPLF